MNASIRPLKSLVFSENSKSNPSPLVRTGVPILAQHYGRRKPRLQASGFRYSLRTELDPRTMCTRSGLRGTRKSRSRTQGAADKSGELVAKTPVGRNIYLIQKLAQVLVAAAVQVGLNPISYPGVEVLDFGLAHALFDGVGLHPTALPVLFHIADGAGRDTVLGRRAAGGLGPSPLRR